MCCCIFVYIVNELSHDYSHAFINEQFFILSYRELKIAISNKLAIKSQSIAEQSKEMYKISGRTEKLWLWGEFYMVYSYSMVIIIACGFLCFSLHSLLTHDGWIKVSACVDDWLNRNESNRIEWQTNVNHTLLEWWQII